MKGSPSRPHFSRFVADSKVHGPPILDLMGCLSDTAFLTKFLKLERGRQEEGNPHGAAGTKVVPGACPPVIYISATVPLGTSWSELVLAGVAWSPLW